MEQQERSKMLGTMPMGRLVPKVSVPIMVSMLVQALYNIVDGILWRATARMRSPPYRWPFRPAAHDRGRYRPGRGHQQPHQPQAGAEAG